MLATSLLGHAGLRGGALGEPGRSSLPALSAWKSGTSRAARRSHHGRLESHTADIPNEEGQVVADGENTRLDICYTTCPYLDAIYEFVTIEFMLETIKVDVLTFNLQDRKY